jgi:hypothetical protein
MPRLNVINAIAEPHITPDPLRVQEAKRLKRPCDDHNPFANTRQRLIDRDKSG